MSLPVRIEIEAVTLAKHQDPQHGKHRRCSQHLRKIADSGRLKLSRGDASINHETESRRARINDFPIIHLRKFWKFSAFGNQQPEQCARALISDNLHVLARQQIAEEGLGRARETLDKRLEARKNRLNESAQNCSEEDSLVIEMQKDRSLGNVRSSRHIVEAGGRIPVDSKLFKCSRQDLFLSLCFLSSPSNGLLDRSHLPILSLFD